MARPNTYTVLAKSNRQIIAASDYLVRRGYPVGPAMSAVCGALFQLLLQCWFNMNDLLAETYEDVTAMAGVTDIEIARAMHEAGIIEKAGDLFYTPWAIPLAPEHARDAWLRCEPETYKAAMARRTNIGDAMPCEAPMTEVSNEPVKKDLFGNPVIQTEVQREPVNQPKPKHQVSEHAEFIRWWADKFSVAKGYEYPFIGGADGAAVSRMLKSIGLDRLRRASASYLGCTEAFFKGWPLTKLAQNLSRFVGEASGSVARKDYGGEESISLGLATGSSVASVARSKRGGNSGVRTQGGGASAGGEKAGGPAKG